MRKGFTLIELLAVIVILAIIALIATPIILGIIEDARKGSIEASANGYIDAVENEIATKLLKEEIKLNKTCEINQDGNLNCEDGIIEIDVNGEKPINGYITFSKDKIIASSLTFSDGTTITNNDLYVIKSSKNNFMYNYDFDLNTDSILYDITGNNNHGNINGPIFTSNGLNFDGIDDYVMLDKFNYNNFTVEITFSLSDGEINKRLVYGNPQGGGFFFEFYNDNGLYIQSGISFNSNYTPISNYQIELNEVYTFTIAYDGEFAYSYVNGVLAGKSQGKINFPSNNTHLAIGTNPKGDQPSSDNYYFIGNVYSARGYDSFLSAEEIKQNYDIDKEKYQ